MQTSELKGAALDWAVARCEGSIAFSSVQVIAGQLWINNSGESIRYAPSTDWAEGGPIIERESILLDKYPDGGWVGQKWTSDELMPTYEEGGPTPLIAAMRCYTASKLGDEVKIPEALE
jgi:hypothetical protein